MDDLLLRWMPERVDPSRAYFSLEAFSIETLLLHAEQSSASTLLELENPTGKDILWLEQGKIVHCVRLGQGEKLPVKLEPLLSPVLFFERLLQWRSGYALYQKFQEPPIRREGEPLQTSKYLQNIEQLFFGDLSDGRVWSELFPPKMTVFSALQKLGELRTRDVSGLIELPSPYTLDRIEIRDGTFNPSLSSYYVVELIIERHFSSLRREKERKRALESVPIEDGFLQSVGLSHEEVKAFEQHLFWEQIFRARFTSAFFEAIFARLQGSEGPASNKGLTGSRAEAKRQRVGDALAIRLCHECGRILEADQSKICPVCQKAKKSTEKKSKHDWRLYALLGLTGVVAIHVLFSVFILPSQVLEQKSFDDTTPHLDLRAITQKNEPGEAEESVPAQPIPFSREIVQYGKILPDNAAGLPPRPDGTPPLFRRVYITKPELLTRDPRVFIIVQDQSPLAEVVSVWTSLDGEQSFLPMESADGSIWYGQVPDELYWYRGTVLFRAKDIYGNVNQSRAFFPSDVTFFDAVAVKEVESGNVDAPNDKRTDEPKE